MVMRRTTKAILFVLIAAAILFAGNDGLYAMGGVPNPWGIVSPAPRGIAWTGTLVMTAQIADVPGLPGGLPADAAPADSLVYKDQIVKIEFFVRLENSKKGSATFSGLAKDLDGYYLFYAIGDYASGRIGEALNKFLSDRVYPNLPGGPYSGGAFTGLTEGTTNVDFQLRVGQGLQAETPLYFNAKITAVTY